MKKTVTNQQALKFIGRMETGEDLPYYNWVDMSGYADDHGLEAMSDALDDNFIPTDDGGLLIDKTRQPANSSDVFATCRHNLGHTDETFNSQYN